MADFQILTNTDLNKNQLKQAVAQGLASDPGSPANGQFWFITTDGTLHFWSGTTSIALGKLNQVTPPDGAVNLNNQKITSLGAPTAAGDAVRKQDLDAAIQGVQYKQAVRAASTGNVNVSAPGSSIDGVTLATNDRILLKNQTAASQNGLYVWNGAAVAATRTADADIDTELVGAACFVTEGTVNVATIWNQTTPLPIVVNTTSLTWAQIGGPGISAGLGIILNGAALDINLLSGGGLEIVSDQLKVDRTKVPFRFAVAIGDGSALTYAITHGLATLDVAVEVFRVSDGVKVYPGIVHTDTGTITITFSVAPTTNQYRVVVVG